MKTFRDFSHAHAKQLLAAGLAWATLFALLYRVLYKISFLMLCLAALGALAALWGGLHLWDSRTARTMRKLLAAALCLGLCLFVGLETLIWAHADGDPVTQCDALIVLGCGIQGETPSLAMVSRLEVALRYLEQYPDCIAVLSGGMGDRESITEALAMYRWLTARGIAPGRMVLEERSTNTIENLQYSLALIPADSKVALVSNEFHLYRAKVIAHHFDREVHTLPAPTPTILFTQVNSWLRESASIALMYLKFWLFY